jgi:tRNA (cmo5U34)-methyltransferase
MSAQYHFDPDTYAQMIGSEVPLYRELQRRVAEHTEDLACEQVLELGTGTGVTSVEILRRHPTARLTGIDISRGMLGQARSHLPIERVRLFAQPLEDPLPEGPFDLVFSVLAVHHLDGGRKQDLYRRVARILRSGGRFVFGDLVIPQQPVPHPMPANPDYDKPSTSVDQVRWLEQAGLSARVEWENGELTMIVGERRG